MLGTHLISIDLSLLRALQALLEERRISRAAILLTGPLRPIESANRIPRAQIIEITSDELLVIPQYGIPLTGGLRIRQPWSTRTGAQS